MATKEIIALRIKARIELPADLDAQIGVLSGLRDAHKTGNYMQLLIDGLADGTLKFEQVSADRMRKRIDDVAEIPAQTDIEDAIADAAGDPPTEGVDDPDASEDPPAFVREESKRRKAAA